MGHCRSTKSAHFLPVKSIYPTIQYAKMYLARIMSLHGVPKTIVSDRGTYFVSSFWKQLHSSLGTKLLYSTAYHPQTDGQTKRVNQVLEDMLRCCVLNYSNKWMNVCLWLSSHTIIVIRRALEWLHLKHSMV